MADIPPPERRSAIRFVPDINWGHILIFVGVIGSAFSAYSAFLRTADNHEFRITTLERSLSRTETVLEAISESLRAVRQDIAVITAAQRRASADPYAGGGTPDPGT